MKFISFIYITTSIYNITVNLLEVSLLEQSFWHSTFHSCFPHFIKASAPAEACNSAENRRSRGFQPIRFFPHGHSAKYFTHNAIQQSIHSQYYRHWADTGTAALRALLFLRDWCSAFYLCFSFIYKLQQ